MFARVIKFKRNILFIISAAFAVLISGLANAQENSASSSDEIFIVCQRDKDIRWVRTFKTDAGTRCKSVYSKEGFAQTVSSGQNFDSCRSVLDNIRKNIEEGGYQCKPSQLLSLVEID